MLLLIETPDMNNPDFKKQYDEIRKLALTDANIIIVVSCPVKEDANFHTDITTAASIRNNSKSFRVMLLDNNGNVKAGMPIEEQKAKGTIALDSSLMQNP
jgi:hypothetical protein